MFVIKQHLRQLGIAWNFCFRKEMNRNKTDKVTEVWSVIFTKALELTNKQGYFGTGNKNITHFLFIYSKWLKICEFHIKHITVQHLKLHRELWVKTNVSLKYSLGKTFAFSPWLCSLHWSVCCCPEYLKAYNLLLILTTQEKSTEDKLF